MTENEAMALMRCRIDTASKIVGKGTDGKAFEDMEVAITALKQIQQHREIGTVEEIRKIIKQGIDNCYMAHRYEHPGYEEDLCAGLRTMNGEGEPCDTCKECYLYYGNQIWGNNNEDD